MEPAVMSCDSSHLWNILGMNTVYGVPHVLPGGDQEGEAQAGHHGQGVVEPEDAGVYLDMGDLGQALQASQDIQHDVDE